METPRKRKRMLKIMDGEDKLSFNSVPSLQRISGVATVIRLWKSAEIMSLLHDRWSEICEYNGHFYEKDPFGFFKKLVSEKIALLCLPGTIKEEMEGYVEPIGMQLFKWIKDEFHSPVFKKRMDLICWTPDGVIDRLNTLKRMRTATWVECKDSCRAMKMIKKDLFRLACFCCAEDTIFALWRKFSAHDRHSLVKQSKSILKTAREEWNDRLYNKEFIVVYWLCICRYRPDQFVSYVSDSYYYKVLSENYSMDLFMLRLSVCEGYLMVTKYFWPKVSAQVKSENMIKWFLKMSFDNGEVSTCCYNADGRAEVMGFLLSHLNIGAQQKEVCQKFREDIVESLYALYVAGLYNGFSSQQSV